MSKISNCLLVAVFCLLHRCITCDPAWETLRVTWGFPLTKPGVFDPMPLTETEALKQNFNVINSKCQSGKFVGFRYWLKSDPAVIVIYDKSGHVAGIQTAIPKDEAQRVRTSVRFDNGRTHQEEVIGGRSFYTQTAYFVHPSRICSNPRSDEELAKSGVAENLYFQNGSNPLTDAIQTPKFESQVGTTRWTKGGCFPTMGRHYWYDITSDMDCKDMYQAFLLYNNGKLTGFGFANPGDFQYSTRFEHPTKPILQQFIVPYPKCMNAEFDQIGGFSSTHFYFNVREENLKC